MDRSSGLGGANTFSCECKKMPFLYMNQVRVAERKSRQRNLVKEKKKTNHCMKGLVLYEENMPKPDCTDYRAQHNKKSNPLQEPHIAGAG